MCRKNTSGTKKKKNNNNFKVIQNLCSDTMLNILLNILWRAEEREREERERKHIMDYIVLSSLIRMDIRASLYRRERGALASNLTNVGRAPHIH